MMTSKEPVLLGSLDLPIPASDSCNYQINKVGGSPDWIEENTQKVICRLCSRESTLVIQIYCPLGQSSSHRTLYLFCCTNIACWNKSESWTALRCQQGDQAKQPTDENTTEGRAKDSSWLSSQDDWDDITDVQDTVSNVLSSITETLSLPQEAPTQVSSSSAVDMEDDSNDSLPSSQHQVIPEPLCLAFRGPFPWKVDTNKSSESGVTPIFCPYYVSVTEEADHELDSSEHINSLVQEYQLHDGNPFYKTGSRSATDSRNQGAESYEKSEVKHGDKSFYKFQKKIARLPQQIVRYQWGGVPLLIRGEELDPPLCENCGSPRVFELQLMPTLISSLKLQNPKGNNNESPVEFGTVIVSSCRSSCWKKGDVVKMEHVLLQSDPDEEFFQMQ